MKTATHNAIGEDGKMKSRQPLLSGLGAAAFAAFFLAAAAPAQASSLELKTSFDKPYVHVSESGDRYLEVDVWAPGGRDGRWVEAPPLNIALVIDKSGSMGQARKMDYVKKAARKLVKRIRPRDRFSIVAYDDHVSVPLPAGSVEDHRRAKRIINSLYPGGSTNLSGGLMEGYSQVRRHYIEGGINRVLLLSDGLANRGITSPWELSRIVSSESARGVSLTTLGVGLDFNEDLMASLAESGRGTYYFIDRPGRIGEILAGEFDTLSTISALDVTITIEVKPHVRIDDVMGYEYRRQGRNVEIHLGDMSAGERRKVMVRLQAPGSRTGEQRIGRVSLGYQPRGGTRHVERASDLELNYVRSRAAVDDSINRDVAERSTVYEANDARRKAADMVDRGDLDGARQVLRKSEEKLRDAPVPSAAVSEELGRTRDYNSSISGPMSREKKKEVQKGVKYDSYRVLQSK